MKEKEVKEKKIVDELLKELRVMEGKKEKILEGVEALTKKPKADPKEIRMLVKRIKKLIRDFKGKLEAIEKMASKI